MEENTPKKKHKLSLIAVLLVIAGVIWLGVSMAYVNMIPDIKKMSPDEVKQVITQDTTKEVPIDMVKGKPMPGVNVMDVGYSNQQLLARGAEVFKNTCSSCHGEKGGGDGPGGANLMPKPRNFTLTEGWKNGRNIGGMFKTLTEGIPGSGMIAYEFLPIEDRFGVIHYIRNMIGGFPEITVPELKQIDDIYDLASPRRTSSQIPVLKAEKNLVADNKVLNEAINSIITRIADNQTEQAILFRKVTADQRKVIATLFKTSAWRSEYNVFVQLVSTNTLKSGFKPSVMKLSKDDMNSLYGFLKFAIN